MKKDEKFLKTLAWALAMVVVIVMIAAFFQGRNPQIPRGEVIPKQQTQQSQPQKEEPKNEKTKKSEQSKLDELSDIIQDRYIGEADRTEVEDAAAKAMVEAIGDRWSYYIPAAEYQQYLDTMDNSYVGVGITVQLMEDVPGCMVIEVIPDGPADEAGLLPGDVLTYAGGEPLDGLALEEIRSKVVGEEGTYVDLTILRQEETLEFHVERRRVEQVVVYYDIIGENIGMITIANFNTNVAEETIQTIEFLREQGVEKLIFDVRFNPGGYAHELVALLDYLLPEGPLFRSQSFTGKESVDNSDPDFLDMPMAVLVNGDSYSAAELFAAAIQEYEAGVIVGQHTTGKGRYQVAYELSDGSAVNLSVGRYFTPNGVDLTGKGIEPDITVDVDEEMYLDIYLGYVAYEDDPQIQAAIEALNGK